MERMKNKWLWLVLTLLVAIALWAFRYFKPARKIDLSNKISILANKYLDTNAVDSKFPFCEILPDQNFDAILVVPPYTPFKSFENFDIKNFGAIGMKVSHLADWNFALIYVKDNYAIGYSIVERRPVDFCRYGTGVYQIKRSDCNALYAHKGKYGYTLFLKSEKY